MNRKLVLLDGNSITHRAFHALPPMDADGTPTNAVFGFFSMLLRALRGGGQDNITVLLLGVESTDQSREDTNG